MSMRTRTVLLAATVLYFLPPPHARAQRQVDRLLRLHQTLASADTGRVWPGFRPDTTPILYVLRGSGTLLAGWKGPLPEGFAAIDGWPWAAWRAEADAAAASTSVELGGRAAAQAVVDTSARDAALVALTVHEAFHVFERASRRAGRRFGTGENSFLVSTYPVFDRTNEAGVALEGRVLLAALSAESDQAARRHALEFLALRAERHRRLATEMAVFEALAELNEGLAEYAGLRAATELAAAAGWQPDAAELRAGLLRRLDDLTGTPELSLRLRYYVTGPAMALLLDRLAGPGWKRELVDSNRTLQDQLGYAVGFFEAQDRLAAGARERFQWPGVLSAAERGVASLLALRRAQVDSALAAPGVLLTIDASALPGGIGLCGIDPQNLLQVDQGILLHTRWLRPCSGTSLQGELTSRIVHDQNAGTLRAVIGPDEQVVLRANGDTVRLGEAETRVLSGLTIDAPGARIRVSRAELRRAGRQLMVRLLPG